MSNIIWSHDYSVHIPIIDNEHKLLIELVNEFGTALETQGTFQTKIVTEMLNKFSRCIRRHFESEERFLMFNNFPEFDEHHQEHRDLLERFDHFQQRFHEEKLPFNDKMLIFLQDWLIRHIILHDSKFGVYFKGKELVSHIS